MLCAAIVKEIVIRRAEWKAEGVVLNVILPEVYLSVGIVLLVLARGHKKPVAFLPCLFPQLFHRPLKLLIFACNEEISQQILQPHSHEASVSILHL